MRVAVAPDLKSGQPNPSRSIGCETENDGVKNVDLATHWSTLGCAVTGGDSPKPEKSGGADVT